jgi:hypothetical protein
LVQFPDWIVINEKAWSPPTKPFLMRLPNGV